VGLEQELRQFIGTQHFYRNLTGLLYTDGMTYLAEIAKAFWLIDLVGSYQPNFGHLPFQLWEREVNVQDRERED
jgi:hypothetical protein